MAAYLSAFYTELVNLIGTACPEVAGNVWPAEVIMRKTLEKASQENRIPYAIIYIPEFVEAEWGLQNDTYAAEVEVLYIRKVPEDLNALRDRLETLRDAFENEIGQPTLAHGQIRAVTRLSWSADLPENERFISKLLPYISGSVWVQVLVGEMPDV